MAAVVRVSTIIAAVGLPVTSGAVAGPAGSSSSPTASASACGAALRELLEARRGAAVTAEDLLDLCYTTYPEVVCLRAVSALVPSAAGLPAPLRGSPPEAAPSFPPPAFSASEVCDAIEEAASPPSSSASSRPPGAPEEGEAEEGRQRSGGAPSPFVSLLALRTRRTRRASAAASSSLEAAVRGKTIWRGSFTWEHSSSGNHSEIDQLADNVGRVPSASVNETAPSVLARGRFFTGYVTTRPPTTTEATTTTPPPPTTTEATPTTLDANSSALSQLHEVSSHAAHRSRAVRGSLLAKVFRAARRQQLSAATAE